MVRFGHHRSRLKSSEPNVSQTLILSSACFEQFSTCFVLLDVLQAFHVLLIFPIRAIEPNDKTK